jgi:hypothetical protein
MPPDEGRKSCVIMAADEVLQQLAIGQNRAHLEKDRPAKGLDDSSQSAGGQLDLLANSTPS